MRGGCGADRPPATLADADGMGTIQLQWLRDGVIVAGPPLLSPATALGVARVVMGSAAVKDAA